MNPKITLFMGMEIEFIDQSEGEANPDAELASPQPMSGVEIYNAEEGVSMEDREAASGFFNSMNCQLLDEGINILFALDTDHEDYTTIPCFHVSEAHGFEDFQQPGYAVIFKRDGVEHQCIIGVRENEQGRYTLKFELQEGTKGQTILVSHQNNNLNDAAEIHGAIMVLLRNHLFGKRHAADFDATASRLHGSGCFTN